MSQLFCGVKPEENDIGLAVSLLKSLNGTTAASMVSGTVSRVARSTNIDNSSNQEPNKNVTSTTEAPKTFCQRLIELLMIRPIQPYTERIRFFLYTYIYYYPSTFVTDTIMKRATASHRLLIKLRDTLTQIQSHTMPTLNEFLLNSDSINRFRKALQACAETGTADSIACRDLLTFLDPSPDPNRTELNIFTVLKNINILFGYVLEILKCANLKSRLVPSTKTQFEGYMELFQKPTFPSGIGVDFRRVPKTLNWTAITNTSEHVFEIALRKIEDTYNFKVFDRYWTPRPRQNPKNGDMKYITTGFIDLQESISQAIVSIASSKPDLLDTPADPTELYSNRITAQQLKLFPTPCYTDRSFLASMAKMLPQFLLFAWIFTAMFTAKCIVEEKEQRLKEFTKIMGVSNMTHWLGWLTMNLLIVLPCSILITLMLKYTRVLQDTNYGILLFLFISYVFSVIALTFLCSTFFTHANLGAVVTGMIYFILYLPTPMILSNEAALPPSAFYGASVSTQVAFSLGMYYILRAESYGMGTRWSTFWSNDQVSMEFSPGKATLMLWVDTAIYLILTWYIEAVYPGRYGVRKPLYFPFTRAYWQSSRDIESDSLNDIPKDLDEPIFTKDSTLFEPPPENALIGIAIRDLTKKYKKRSKPALDGLSMNFYADQVTSLLGHNGAGKSTLMSILTGMQSASSGLALVAGHDIQKQLQTVRDMVGFCPQYNILFDNLTVAEHIQFYASLKGVDRRTISSEIDRLMDVLGFPDKRDDRSKSLSGGQKRKLSVAIAFVGRSKVVFLDEPTAGVDPYSRRSIWDLIICLKPGRTIVLTTHHMDEADILGDRIAIISQGRLKCEGSSLFLKANHGQGYHLILQRIADDNDSTTETSSSIHNQEILDYIQRYMPMAELVDVCATELTLQLPGHYAIDGTFTHFFKHMESNPPHQVPDALLKLGIVGYGLSDTSLEEVFLEMADDPAHQVDLLDEIESVNTASNDVESEQHFKKEDAEKERNGLEQNASERDNGDRKRRGHFARRRSQLDTLRHSSRLQRFTDGGQLPAPATRRSLVDRRRLFSQNTSQTKRSQITKTDLKQLSLEELKVSVMQQLRAMFPKRFHHFKRYKKGWLIEFLLPILLILLAMGFISIVVRVTMKNPPMPISPWLMAPKRGELATFYENQAYAKEDPQEWSLSSGQIYQVVMDYERALGAPYGWTGTRCLPKEIYQFIPQDHSSCEETWTSLPPWEPQFELSAVEREMARNSSHVVCSCRTGGQICPADSIKPNPPPHVDLQTTDVLYNLTAYNVTEYLLKTSDHFFLRRFGGLSFILDPNWPIRGLMEQFLNPKNPLYAAMGALTPVVNQTGVNKTDPAWADLANIIRLMLPPPYHMRIWFNNKGYVSSVAYLNMLQNMQLRMVEGVTALTTRRSYGLVIINHPLDSPPEVSVSDSAPLFYDATLALFTILALSFIPASFITFLVLEVQTGSKHLQMVSGLNGYVYWLSVYLWDIVNFIAPTLLCVIVFVAFQKYAYIGSDSIGAFLGLLFLYGLSVLPMLYPASFFIRNPSTALVIVAVFNLLLGATTVMATFLLDYLQQGDSSLIPINSALKSIFLIFPQYAFGRGIYNLAIRYNLLALRDSGLIDTQDWENPFAWNVVGRHLFAMGLEAIIYSVLVVLIEHDFYRSRIRDYFHARYPRLEKRYTHRLQKRLARLDREDGTGVANDVREEQYRVRKCMFKQTDTFFTAIVGQHE
ncbi:unnamed protein product [Echinostoma caproni]|uniref:ABC transporter domain-containing protein n=1 Tax=Echinostoma caproni TaxID=27848 RepID=A0A183ATB3_9TREM|nr:unnamed protein product [Echinostoma caproni]